MSLMWHAKPKELPTLALWVLNTRNVTTDKTILNSNCAFANNVVFKNGIGFTCLFLSLRRIVLNRVEIFFPTNCFRLNQIGTKLTSLN